MKIIDVNVLVYATFHDSAQHTPASAWLRRALSDGISVGIPWATVTAFLRLVTNPRVIAAPLGVQQASDLLRSWLAPSHVVVIEPTARHLDVLTGLLQTSGTAGNLVPDAHLAALALEYGGEVVSFDRDLARFGVSVVVPT